MYDPLDLKARIESELASSPGSMAEIARRLDINYKTLRVYAKEFGLFTPNPQRKGISRESSEYVKKQTPLEDILAGLHPNYHSSHLKRRLIKAGLLEEKCSENCGVINTYNGKPLVLQLDHINGDSTDHQLCNLRLLCPNCHSQSDTYCGRAKIGVKQNRVVTDEFLGHLKLKLQTCDTVGQALTELGVPQARPYYIVAENLIRENPDLAKCKAIQAYTSNRKVKVTRTPAQYRADRHAEWLKLQADKIKLLHSLDFDFQKNGWIAKVAKALNLNHQKVVSWIEKVDPSFLEKCVLRPSPRKS